MLKKALKFIICVAVILLNVVSIQAQEKGDSSSSDGKTSNIEDLLKNTVIRDKDDTGFTIEIECNDENIKENLFFKTWTKENGQDDVIIEKGVSGDYYLTYRVNTKDHKNEYGVYQIDILEKNEKLDTENLYPLQEVEVGVIPVESEMKESVEQEAPEPEPELKEEIQTIELNDGVQEISTSSERKLNQFLFKSVVIRNADATGYTVDMELESSFGLKEVRIASWTEKNGQDDLAWGSGIINGNRVSYRVNTKDHKYESGLYNTHIYAYDNSGNDIMTIAEMTKVDKGVFKFNSTKIENVDATGYTVNMELESSFGIKEVRIASWTEKNGQDDLIWSKGTISGNRVSYRVNTKDHGYESGFYNTHIYAYDNSGNDVMTIAEMAKVDNGVFKFKTVKIENVDATGYTVNMELESSFGLKEVRIASWTEKNGQDDLIWSKGTISGNRVSYRVNTKDHRYESGLYNTHIYAYDNSGNDVMTIAEMAKVDKGVFKFKTVKIENIDATGYTVNMELESTFGLKEVRIASWTEKNGQDDLIWSKGTISGNRVSYRVNTRDHKYETGLYNTHIYAYDNSGNDMMTIAEMAKVDKATLKFKSVSIKNVDTTGYTVDMELESTLGLKEVRIASWTEKNGQDDLIWRNATINGNHVSYRVNTKDHKYETGLYNTHIYAYDNGGNDTMTIADTVKIEKGSFKFKSLSINDVDTTGYTVNMDIESAYGLKEVRIASWTEKNGQDDIFWGKAVINGNRASYRVNTKNHEFQNGYYNTHIYAYDNNGNEIMTIANTTTIKTNPPLVENVRVSDITPWGYTVKADIADEFGVSRVAFPTWTEKNGQDDVKWFNGTIVGNEVTFHVDIRDHNGENGIYNTHIYAYNYSGDITIYTMNSISIPKMTATGWTVKDGVKYLVNNKGEVVNGARELIIDVSVHNGIIDWDLVKSSGVDGVILRSSFGFDYDSYGKPIFKQVDEMFARNVKELNRLGIPYGVYHFSYATELSHGVQEAQYVLDVLKAYGAKPTLPVYYDIEYDDYIGDKTPAFYTSISKAFCDKIAAAGYEPGIYANLNYWNNKLYDSSLNRYTKWVAQYNSNDGTAGNCTYDRPYKMWQYTSVGKIQGIKGNVDMNALFK